jgi:hypothetical protein
MFLQVSEFITIIKGLLQSQTVMTLIVRRQETLLNTHCMETSEAACKTIIKPLSEKPVSAKLVKKYSRLRDLRFIAVIIIDGHRVPL